MKNLLLTFLLFLPLGMMAQITQTVTVDGTTVSSQVTTITFTDETNTLKFLDGTTQTFDLDDTVITFNYPSPDEDTGSKDPIEPSSVKNVKADPVKATGVYDLAGRYLGNSTDGLSSGIYIVNGVKVLINSSKLNH